jgi:hypothetical protein
VKKLERAARLARTARVPISLPQAHELRRVANSINHQGLDRQMADLRQTVSDAVAVEAQLGLRALPRSSRADVAAL